MEKRAIVVGAGISGLSQAIFLQKMGINTTVFELNGSGCLGLSSVKYKESEYNFYLSQFCGLKKDSIANRLWHELGVLDDNVNFFREDFSIYEIDGEEIYFYHDLNKFKDSLLAMSEGKDKKNVDIFCKDLKFFMDFDLSVNIYSMLKMDFKNSIKYFFLYFKYAKVSVEKFANKFKSLKIQNFIKSIFPQDFAMLPFVQKISSIFSGDAGCLNISLEEFTTRLIKSFENLGGKINFNSKVDQIVYEGKKAIGINSNNKFFRADVVVSTIDLFELLSNLLDGKLKHAQIIKRLKRRELYFATMEFYFFLNKSFDLPYFSLLEFDENGVNTTPDFSNIFAEVENIKQDESGESCLKVTLRTYYDYWSDLKNRGENIYNASKYMVADDLSVALDKLLKNFKASIKYCKVVTPASTLNNIPAFRGVRDGFFPKPAFYLFPLRKKVANLQNLYISGLWTILEPTLDKAIVQSKKNADKIYQNFSKLDKKKK